MDTTVGVGIAAISVGAGVGMAVLIGLVLVVPAYFDSEWSRRVSPGDGIAAVGGGVLLVAFFLNWYSGEPSIAPIEIGSSFLAQVEPPFEVPDIEFELEVGPWDGAGVLAVLANLVMLAAVLWSIAAFLAATVRELPRARELTAALGVAATLMVLLRIIFPVEEIGGVDVDASLKFGIFLALAGAILIAIGSVMSRGEAPFGLAGPARHEPPPPPPPAEPPPPSQPPPG